MPRPLVCNNTTQGHIDYGVPIIASRSTDYRTSTGSFHGLVPEKPTDFDCRVKARVKPALLESDVTIRDETSVSNYGYQYQVKCPQKDYPLQVMVQFDKCNYVQNIQEKMFRKPPPPKIKDTSEAKASYDVPPYQPERRAVYPPEPNNICEIKGLGRDEQPGIPPEQKGFYRWLDPYLSATRGAHVPFTIEQQNGLARKDIITFYDAANYPKAKGFGPKSAPATEPLNIRRKYPMTDLMPFKLHPTGRFIRPMRRAVPNFGKSSEYRSKYISQSYSDLFPYLFQCGVEFPEALCGASPWQNLVAPGMYCSDSCHIGTGWPVNAVIDYGLPKEYVVHPPCHTKFCDWSQ